MPAGVAAPTMDTRPKRELPMLCTHTCPSLPSQEALTDAGRAKPYSSEVLESHPSPFDTSTHVWLRGTQATRRGGSENPHFPAPQAPKHCRPRHQEPGEARGELLKAHLTAMRPLATLHPAPNPPTGPSAKCLALGTRGGKRALAQGQTPKCPVTPQATSQVVIPSTGLLRGQEGGEGGS